jgi:hypothetical protein
MQIVRFERLKTFQSQSNSLKLIRDRLGAASTGALPEYGVGNRACQCYGGHI